MKGSKPPLNMRPRTNGGNNIIDSIRSRLTRTIDQGGEEDRNSATRSSVQSDTVSLLRERTLQKMRREKRGSRANLAEAIKGMNESQLNKISKMLKVRIGKNQEDTGSQRYEDEGPHEYTGSMIGETEADELND